MHIFYITFVLKMDAVYFYETSVTRYQIKLCHFVDEHKLIHAFDVFVFTFVLQILVLVCSETAWFSRR